MSEIIPGGEDKMSIKILGISALYHDSAAALVIDGRKFGRMYYGDKTKDNIGIFLKNKFCMNALCSLMGIRYWSFLQPNICSIDRIHGSMAKSDYRRANEPEIKK
jgi:hypothetical protein